MKKVFAWLLVVSIALTCVFVAGVSAETVYTDVTSLMPTDESKVTQVNGKTDVTLADGKLTLAMAEGSDPAWPSVEVTEAAGKEIDLAATPYLHLSVTIPEGQNEVGANGIITYTTGDGVEGQFQLSALRYPDVDPNTNPANDDYRVTTDVYLNVADWFKARTDIQNPGKITIKKFTLSIYVGNATWNTIAFASAEETLPEISFQSLTGGVVLSSLETNSNLNALVDGDRALDATSWGSTQFVGFNRKEDVAATFEVLIDLKQIKPIGSINLDFFLDSGSGITMPTAVTVEGSADGEVYYNLGSENVTIPESSEEKKVNTVAADFSSRAAINVRYIKATISFDSGWVFLSEIGVGDANKDAIPVNPNDPFTYTTENTTENASVVYGIAVFNEPGEYDLNSNADPRAFNGSQITVAAWEEAAKAYRIRFNECNAWSAEEGNHHVTPSVTLEEGEIMIVIKTTGAVSSENEVNTLASEVKWIMRGMKEGDYIVLDTENKTLQMVPADAMTIPDPGPGGDSSEETSSDTPSEETSSDTPSEETSSGTPSEETSGGTPSEETSSGTPSEETSGGTPSEGTSSNGSSGVGSSSSVADTSSSPKTGDNSGILVFAVLGVLATVGAIIVVKVRR